MSVGNSSISSSVRVRDDYDIFISYSRRDKDFVRQLWEALTQVNQDVWVDWDDIPPAEDWRQEIYRGIEAAHNFVFVLSPHSTASTVCGEELAYAIKHGKRLVPIVYQKVEDNQVNPELAKINYIFFDDSANFESALQKLIHAIEIDLNYVRAHTRLLVDAREWDNTGRDSSFLLRGSELEKAQQWLAEGTSKEPQPTALQREYIDTSQVTETERQKVELRLHHLSPQQVKNRQALLNKVGNYWVKGVLEASLHEQVLIELGLEERAGAVTSPWNIELETADEAQKPLPQGTKIISIFDRMGEGRTLLILGEPGAGKTTTLLDLTRDLVNRAEQGIDYRIPVVFNLSSWRDEKQAIADWLVEELNTKYQVPKQIAQTWVKEQQLLLLLDGLDEVKPKYREACIVALNVFYQDYSPEIVVCSRLKDYEALSNRLNFQGAIYLRSLSPEQVRHYLESDASKLSGLRTLIEGDTALQELASSPLMLNIMTLAYQGVAVEDLPKTDVVEERRKQLFNAYIERMFKRRGTEQRYSKAQATRWLTWLAQRMVSESQTVFLIERMQPTWLQTQTQKRLYSLGIPLVFGLILGLIVIWVIFIWGLIWGLIFGLFAGRIFFAMVEWGRAEIKTVEILKWSWKDVRDLLFSWQTYTYILALIFALISSIFSKSLSSQSFFILLLLLMLVVSRGLQSSLKGSEMETKTSPNQGIRRSAMNAGIMGLIYMLFMGLLSWCYGYKENLLIYLLSIGLILGLIEGGGKACIQHFTLRLILYRNDFIPWNYAHFLDYAVERIFLQKVGGGYIFIHRLLLEHFAQMEPTKVQS